MSDKLIKSTHEARLKLGDNELECYILEDGTRLISQNAVFRAFGRGKRGIRRISEGGIKVPSFMDAKNLEPFVDKDLEAVINPIEFKSKSGQRIYGYKAEVIPMVCELYLKARDQQSVLTKPQLIVAKTAEILIRSLAKVGIIALVDEATGYQYDRERFELQAILQAFISEEILDWQRTFELSFYKEIFRLWNIPFTAANIKKKPMFIGKLTNELVYKNMPKGYFVLDKLKEKTPKTDGGNYKYRLHQSLTKESGRTALIKVINTVEALASISNTKAHFLKLMKDKYNPDLQTSLFPEIDNLAKNEDKKDSVPLNTFNKNLKGLLNVPPPKKDKY
jgi:P63C domain-containing protein